jgi:hypothetical protein
MSSSSERTTLARPERGALSAVIKAATWRWNAERESLAPDTPGDGPEFAPRAYMVLTRNSLAARLAH